MTHPTGTIANYDAASGAGFIQPEAGGERLPFTRGDLPAGGHVPLEQDRYTYETAGSGADCCAVKLHKV